MLEDIRFTGEIKNPDLYEAILRGRFCNAKELSGDPRLL